MATTKKKLVEFVVTQTGQQLTQYVRLPSQAKRIVRVTAAVTRLLDLPYEATFRITRRDSTDKLAELLPTPLPAYNLPAVPPRPAVLAYAPPADFFTASRISSPRVELVTDEFVALVIAPAPDPLYYAHSVRLGLTTFQDQKGVAVSPLPGWPVLLRGATVRGTPLATGDYYLWKFAPVVSGRIFALGLNLLPARFQ